MEHQCIVSIVPSKKNEVFVFAGGELRCFSSPALAAKGLEIIAGRNIDEWLAGIDEKKRSAVEKRLEFFHQLEGNKTLIFGIMGGSGQALFMRAADLGLDVRRIPISRLYALTQVEPKSSPGERCEAITNAWGQDESAFYPLAPIDPSILLARGLARERLGIQDLRKPMQLRFHAGLRDAQYILPVESEGLISLIKKAVKDLFHNRKLVEQIAGALESLRALLPSSFQQRLQGVMGHYAQPRFIVAAKEEEEKLEKYILELIGDLPIWKTLHANGNSKLPGVKGLGPALGGVIIGEIGDIRRFPSASDLRSYARFGLKDGFFPKRKAKNSRVISTCTKPCGFGQPIRWRATNMCGAICTIGKRHGNFRLILMSWRASSKIGKGGIARCTILPSNIWIVGRNAGQDPSCSITFGTFGQRSRREETQRVGTFPRAGLNTWFGWIVSSWVGYGRTLRKKFPSGAGASPRRNPKKK